VASTARRFDKEEGQWIDGDSLYLKVNCWRALADNVDRSVVQGDPVIITGRLYTRTYEADGQRRSSYELEASAVGLDLSRGVAAFSRTKSGAAPTYEVTGEAGAEATDDANDRDDADDRHDATEETGVPGLT
jgi:single-strand DNA-binding protein